MHFHPSYILCAFLSISHAKAPYESDMRLNEEQLLVLRGATARNIMPWSKYYWPSSTVVYTFGDGLSKCVCIVCVDYKIIISPKINSKK